MRIKRGLTTHRRHKKFLALAKGFRGARHRLYKMAREAVERSWSNSFGGRKQRKRNMRELWIIRVNAGARENGLSYSKFMRGLKLAGIILNRKVMSNLAIEHKEDFAALVAAAKKAL